ncbi:hypothetical protein SBC1_15150 [Caballeronia sp. SBC1]|nr:hypothetical protein SBC2_16550 [Caballeronia sp. SBC2]QIN61523.1 hypothetical protein SBC1_15150 [Caballeronia sp. SBC1]
MHVAIYQASSTVLCFSFRWSEPVIFRKKPIAATNVLQSPHAGLNIVSKRKWPASLRSGPFAFRLIELLCY